MDLNTVNFIRPTYPNCLCDGILIRSVFNLIIYATHYPIQTPKVLVANIISGWYAAENCYFIFENEIIKLHNHLASWVFIYINKDYVT